MVMVEEKITLALGIIFLVVCVEVIEFRILDCVLFYKREEDNLNQNKCRYFVLINVDMFG